MVNNKKFGLALSGGGYRAAGFHIGTLKKLHDMGLLNKLDHLSTISGGSIVGAAYSLHKGSFEEFEKKMIDTLSQKSVIKYVLTSWRFLAVALPLFLLFSSVFILPFTAWAPYSIISLLIFVVIIVRYQFKVLPLSKIIESAYDEYFFKQATLSQLCEIPEIAINATNLQTIRHFTFSRRKMEDATYAYYDPPIYFKNANFPVARAVMASSCVPFGFTPVSIGREYYNNPLQYDQIDPKLIDGGVYDNQGAHKLMQWNSSYSCQIVIVSDAGNKLPFQKAYNNTFTLLLRTVEAFMMRIKKVQMMQNIYTKHQEKEVAYLSIGWDIDQCVNGFYRNLLDRNIIKETIIAHELEEKWILNPKDYKEEIISHLNTRVHYEHLKSNGLSSERIEAIRNIGTNLVPIKKALIKDMIIHAANMTEIQIKLYCPSLA